SSMSDSEDSIVTYTEISSPYEDLSDVGSPGVEGPIFQDPPSPDYVPGPEEPEQAPPSPDYVFTQSSYQWTMRYSWLRSSQCLLLTHLLISHQG
ncbi:hypothetical protein Tco_0354734, partial [Tanacetum coccineum]